MPAFSMRQAQPATRGRGASCFAMLKVGLTGGVGSGKTSVARVWEAEGVPILEADALGRALMEPGQAVYAAIVSAFGPGVVHSDGTLDRAALAAQAFSPDPHKNRLQELNALVHPAVIAAQQALLQQLAAAGHLLAVVESALLFEASDGSPASPASVPGWRQRFDRIVLVAAPETTRIERFVSRTLGHAPLPDNAQTAEAAQTADTLRRDARRRIAAQLPETWKRQHSDYIAENNRTLVLLRREALRVLAALRTEAHARLLPQPMHQPDTLD
jgi:dephospho-CoA kinase